MPGGAAAGNPGPSPAGGPQAEPEPRRPRGEGAASRGAAALPAGGFSVSFRARAGTGLPGARRGRGRECARVGRCGRAWLWVCMCVCVFMGEVGVCVPVCKRERARECEPGRARECVCVLVSHCELHPSLREDGAGQTDGGRERDPPPSALSPPLTPPVQSRNQTCKIPPSNQARAPPYTGIVSLRKTFACKAVREGSEGARRGRGSTWWCSRRTAPAGRSSPRPDLGGQGKERTQALPFTAHQL